MASNSIDFTIRMDSAQAEKSVTNLTNLLRQATAQVASQAAGQQAASNAAARAAQIAAQAAQTATNGLNQQAQAANRVRDANGRFVGSSNQAAQAGNQTAQSANNAANALNRQAQATNRLRDANGRFIRAPGAGSPSSGQPTPTPPAVPNPTPVANPFGNLLNGAAQARGALGGVVNAFGLVRGTIAGIVAGELAQFAKKMVDSAATAESAFKGLESVANRSGVGIEKSWAAVLELSEDGVMSQTQAATALKNMFARGFNLEESIEMIKAFKDSAAFGRQASLEWGDAVVTATEGLKNENSALVDNAGVTKNVAKMWEEYAKKKNISYNDLTLQQKREAEHAGVMKETANQAGDTAKALAGLQGTNARLGKSFTDLSTAIGSELSPAYRTLGDSLSWLVDKTTAWIKLTGNLKDAVSPFKVAVDAVKAATDSGPAPFSERFQKRAAERVTGSFNGAIAAGNKMLGLNIPQLPPLTVAPPALSTNKTGIPVAAPGPGGKVLQGPTASTQNVKDNIDEKKVAQQKAEKAKEEAEGLAKQQYNKLQKQQQLAKQASDDDLSIYKSGLDAQRAVLEEKLAKNPQLRQEYARKSGELELAELNKTEEARVKRVADLEKQLDLAKQTGDKEKEAEAQQALNSEKAQGEVNANKIKQIKIDADKEVFEASKQTAEERRSIEEQLLQAKINAEKNANDAIHERELAAVQALYDQRIISEEDYLKRSAAIRDKALQEDLKRIKEQQAFLAKQQALSPTQAAADKAKSKELESQVEATETRRAQLVEETNSKIELSSKQLAQLRGDLEQQLLEAEGKTFEARSRMIDNWLEEKRAELQAFPDLLAKAERIASGQKKSNRFEEEQEKVNTTNSEYDRAQRDLQRRSEQGLLTDIALDRQSLALKKAQADALRERLSLLQENSNGSTANAQAIADLETQIADLDAAFSSTAASINDEFFSSISQGFKDLITGAKSFGDVLRNIVSSVLSKLAELAMNQALGSLMGGYGGKGGGLGGALSNFLFGGFRAAGGDVQAGTAYIVGEKGPELMIAGANGQIISNKDIHSAMLGMTTRKMPTPLMGVGARPELAQASAPSVNNHISPKVFVTTEQIREALRNDPGFERDIVDTVARNGKRIQSKW